MSAPEQEHGLHVTDALKEYEQAIRTMPEKPRRVFLMRRVDGLSYREIHEKLGISISTVEYPMVRALGHLSDAMELYRRTTIKGAKTNMGPSNRKPANGFTDWIGTRYPKTRPRL